MRVALFSTCVVDGMVPRIGRATIAILRRLGIDVELPLSQTCCGQMHVNTGYPQLAADLIGNHVDTFEPYDAIVAPSGSCVAAIREQHVVLARDRGDAELAARAASVAERTYELSQFLIDVLKVTDVGAFYPHRVTYHPTCHSLRLLRVGDRPMRLLRAVKGIDLVELPGADECCGFGGTFALKNSAVSAAILADKLTAVAVTGAEVCTAGDASCLLHIGGGLGRSGTSTRAVHLAEILASTRDGEWR